MSKSLHSIENERLLAWLKSTRESKELTMRELALKLDKPHSYVGKIEQGERRLDVAEFLEYCEALEVSPVDGLKAMKSNARF